MIYGMCPFARGWQGIGVLHKSRCCHFSPSNIPTLVVYTIYQPGREPNGPSSVVLDNCIRECGLPRLFHALLRECETMEAIGTLDVISRQKNAENEITKERMKEKQT